MVCPFPLFHMGAWTMALQQWQARDAMVFTTPDPVEILDAIERHRATAGALPARHLAAHPRRSRHAGSDVRATCRASDRRRRDHGDADRVAHRDRTARCRTQSVRVFYGSTEAGLVTSLAAGRRAPQARERRRARRRSPRCASRDGELWVRGPLLFDGYLDDPEATAAALSDGWYHTGDVVDVDDEGYVLDRRPGAARSSAPVARWSRRWRSRRCSATHPAVADVAVIGIPDQQWGETVVCAVIVAEAGRPVPTLDDLRSFCESRLGPLQATPAGRGGRRHPAHPRHPAGPPPSPSSSASPDRLHLALQYAFSVSCNVKRGVGYGSVGGWNERLLLTGIGGQGIQLAAQVLARAALTEGREVQLFGSYGGMMRGGNTEATLVVADGPVEAPPTVDRRGRRSSCTTTSRSRRSPGCGPGSVLFVNTTVFERAARRATVRGRRRTRRPTSRSTSATS